MQHARHGKCKLVIEKPEEKDHLEDLGVNRIIICILRYQGMRVWTGFIWLRTETNSELL
jgi:hypothetical protein